MPERPVSRIEPASRSRLNRAHVAGFNERIDPPTLDPRFIGEKLCLLMRISRCGQPKRKYSEVLWQGRWCLLLQSWIVICVARKVTALAVGVGLLELGEPKCVRELVELCR